MEFRIIDLPALAVSIQLSAFIASGGPDEYHALLHVKGDGLTFAQQLDHLQQACHELCCQVLPHAHIIMRRYLLSDVANQASAVCQRLVSDGCSLGAVSMVGQPPLDGSKIALWIYLATGVAVEEYVGETICTWGGVRHFFTTNLQSAQGGSSSQTRHILENYEAHLASRGMTLADNCLRTWFFIRDVDTNYKGMVEARCGNFTMQHLTPDTHYIASTGIGGQPIQTESRVQMDAYSAKGLLPHQIHYLKAPTHLNPTYQYGVTFERGTSIDYADRRHLIISGTASIDNKGSVVHPGDIEAQTCRMLQNVEALLHEGGASASDIVQAIIYLRDVADYATVSRCIGQRLPMMPHVITLAPVCRPAWLVEMECMAIIPT